MQPNTAAVAQLSANGALVRCPDDQASGVNIEIIDQLLRIEEMVWDGQLPALVAVIWRNHPRRTHSRATLETLYGSLVRRERLAGRYPLREIDNNMRIERAVEELRRSIDLKTVGN